MSKASYSNKIRKLEKYVKKNPNDVQSKERLDNLKKDSTLYSVRKKPENKLGWLTSTIAGKSADYKKLLNPEKRKSYVTHMAQVLKFNKKSK